MSAPGAQVPDLRAREVTSGLTAAEVALLVVPASNWVGSRDLPTFNFLNGDKTYMRPLLMKPSMSMSYRWVRVAGHSVEDASCLMDAYIMSHYVHLLDFRPEGWSDALVRKAAIVLGTVRAVVTTFMQVAPANLVDDECVGPIYDARLVGTNGAVMTVLPGYEGTHMDALTMEMDYTAQEQAVICGLMPCAAGVVALQGYSLMMTNRHYLSDVDGPSRKAFIPAEKAYLTSQSIGNWVTQDKEVILDCLWHKATHPVSIALKQTAATSASMPARLIQAGAAACASRLPAVEPELRAAASYLKLCNHVSPLLTPYGGAINTERLETLVELVKSFPPLVANTVIPASMPAEYVKIVCNRTTGLEVLGAMLRRNEDVAAWAYGFFCAQEVKSPMMDKSFAWTLKASYSLSKLARTSRPSYIAGQVAYDEYAAAKAKEGEKSVFTAPDEGFE